MVVRLLLAGLSALALSTNDRNSKATDGVTHGQHTLEITYNRRRGDPRYYSVSVSQSIRPLGNVERLDTINGNTISGRLTDGTDTYVFDGEITSIELGDGLVAFVDGEEI